MLKITLGPYEAYDNVNNEFVSYPEKEYVFNFNLVALDKWESKHRKRLLDNEDITQKEYLDFFLCMCDSDDLDINFLTGSEYGSNTAYLIQSFDKKKQGISDNATLDVFYTFSTKYEVLDANATNLLFSNCPMFPIGQENVGNREIFANYVEGFDLKDKDGEDVLVDYEVINKQSNFSETEQNRKYRDWET